MMNGVYIFFQRMESLAKVFEEHLRSAANVIILVGNKFSGIKVLVEDYLVQGGSIFCPQIRFELTPKHFALRFYILMSSH